MGNGIACQNFVVNHTCPLNLKRKKDFLLPTILVVTEKEKSVESSLIK